MHAGHRVHPPLHREAAPEIRRYFVLGAHDDTRGIWENYVQTVPAGLQILMTTAGMVAVNVIAGVTVALFLSRLTMPMSSVLPVGIAAFALSVVAFQVHEVRCWRRLERSWTPAFPSASEADESAVQISR